MKRIALLLLLACTQYIAIAKEDEGIQMNRPLVWDDFKAPAPSDGFTALTYSRIELEPITITRGGDIPELKAVCYFMPERSWVNGDFLRTGTQQELDYVLKHEQLHHDIALIATAEINYALNHFDYDMRRFGAQVDSIFKRLQSRLYDIQESYDRETDHSRNTEAQQHWNDLIAKCKEANRLPVKE